MAGRAGEALIVERPDGVEAQDVDTGAFLWARLSGRLVHDEGAARFRADEREEALRIHAAEEWFLAIAQRSVLLERAGGEWSRKDVSLGQSAALEQLEHVPGGVLVFARDGTIVEVRGEGEIISYPPRGRERSRELRVREVVTRGPFRLVRLARDGAEEGSTLLLRRGDPSWALAAGSDTHLEGKRLISLARERAGLSAILWRDEPEHGGLIPWARRGYGLGSRNPAPGARLVLELAAEDARPSER